MQLFYFLFTFILVIKAQSPSTTTTTNINEYFYEHLIKKFSGQTNIIPNNYGPKPIVNMKVTCDMNDIRTIETINSMNTNIILNINEPPVFGLKFIDNNQKIIVNRESNGKYTIILLDYFNLKLEAIYSTTAASSNSGQSQGQNSKVDFLSFKGKTGMLQFKLQSNLIKYQKLANNFIQLLFNNVKLSGPMGLFEFQTLPDNQVLITIQEVSLISIEHYKPTIDLIKLQKEGIKNYEFSINFEEFTLEPLQNNQIKIIINELQLISLKSLIDIQTIKEQVNIKIENLQLIKILPFDLKSEIIQPNGLLNPFYLTKFNGLLQFYFNDPSIINIINTNNNLLILNIAGYEFKSIQSNMGLIKGNKNQLILYIKNSQNIQLRLINDNNKYNNLKFKGILNIQNNTPDTLNGNYNFIGFNYGFNEEKEIKDDQSKEDKENKQDKEDINNESKQEKKPNVEEKPSEIIEKPKQEMTLPPAKAINAEENNPVEVYDLTKMDLNKLKLFNTTIQLEVEDKNNFKKKTKGDQIILIINEHQIIGNKDNILVSEDRNKFIIEIKYPLLLKIEDIKEEKEETKNKPNKPKDKPLKEEKEKEEIETLTDIDFEELIPCDLYDFNLFDKKRQPAIVRYVGSIQQTHYNTITNLIFCNKRITLNKKDYKLMKYNSTINLIQFNKPNEMNYVPQDEDYNSNIMEDELSKLNDYLIPIEIKILEEIEKIQHSIKDGQTEIQLLGYQLIGSEENLFLDKRSENDIRILINDPAGILINKL